MFSLMCFTGIVASLMVYDKNPAPGFSFGHTLNAIISLLAAASKFSLIFVIAECIGQLKWLWFYESDQKRQLDDMQLFDDASRGRMGSMSIIWRHRGRLLVSLGALVTALAFAFDPFMQQIISYPIKTTVVATDSDDVVVKQATSPVLEAFSDLELGSIIFPGQWADKVDITATCPTGNCTWPAFDSVELCHQCEDITELFEIDCHRYVFDTSDGRPGEQRFRCEVVDPLTGYPFFIEVKTFETSHDVFGILVANHFLWMRFSLDYPVFNQSETTFAGLQNPQFVVGHAQYAMVDDGFELPGISPLENMGPHIELTKVEQCALALCSRTNEISVTNGVISVEKSPPDSGEVFYINGSTGEVLHHVVPTELDRDEQERIVDWVRPGWKPGTGGPSDSVAELAWDSVWVNSSALTFCSIATYWRLTQFTDGGGYWEWTMENQSAWVHRTEHHGSAAAKVLRDGLETSMGNIAASLSRAALVSSNRSVYGAISQGEAYVLVDWIWILLPSALVLLGVCFLLLTILANRRQHLHL
jgi:hypothetical protein